jgi:hypothetical protein
MLVKVYKGASYPVLFDAEIDCQEALRDLGR